MMVTEEVDLRAVSYWKDAIWLDRLDVVSPDSPRRRSLVSQSADALTHGTLLWSRAPRGIDRIQFALAGMNAHINHDQSWPSSQPTSRAISTRIT
jgi:hypothetical protein